jgi:hypothetical protein
VHLSDGTEHLGQLYDLWLCAPCSVRRWTPSPELDARRHRLQVFRQVASEGHRGVELWRVAEARIREAS